MCLLPVALDLGNNTINLIINGKVYYIDTLVKKTYQSRMVFGKGDTGEPLDYLDVDIESAEIKGSYYVGKLAGKGGGGQDSLGGFKSENDMLLAAAFTAMAGCLALNYIDTNEFNISLGTGLPVREFFLKNENGEYAFEKVRKFRDRLVGSHKVKFNSTLFSKRQITLNIETDNIDILPEGYAALLTIISDENGNILPRYAKPNVNVVVGDIGGGSCDFAGFSNGTYIEELMFGFDIGINEAQDMVCDSVKSKGNLSKFTRSDFNTYLYDPELKGVVETNKGQFNLNEIKLEYYKPLADKIVYNFKKAIHANSFDESMIHYMFMVGGGSTELGEMFKDRIKDEIPIIEVAEDAMERNVRAYYNAAVQSAGGAE